MKNISGLKRILIIVSISLAVFSNFRCGTDRSSGMSDDSTLRIFIKGDETALGPSLNEPWFLVFLGLSTKDENGNLLPRLMESWEGSPDFIDWTVNLRRDIFWDDGVPVTAEDVRFSLNLWTHPDIAYEARFYKHITIVDDYTLQLEYNKAFNNTIHVYNWLPILPKHLLETLDTKDLFSWEFWKQPVGNGPYRYLRHLPKTMIELEANPNYYGEEPKIKKVILRFGGNPLTELMSGNVDIINDVSPLETLLLKKDPRFRVYYDTNYRQQIALVWNHRLSFFNDPKVRKALTMAINRSELHKVLNYPDDIPIYDVVTQARHHLSGSAPEPLPFDPNQAKILLEKAGWIDTDKNGVREKDGKEFRFTLTTEPNLAAESVYVQDQLHRVGIKMEISYMERRNFRDKVINQNDFESALGSFDRLGNGQFGYLHATGYDNPEFYRLGKAGWDVFLPELEDESYFKLWPMFQADIPVTYLHPGIRFSIAHRRVKGLRNNSLRGSFFSTIEHLWIDEEK